MEIENPKVRRVVDSNIVVLSMGNVEGLFDKLRGLIPGLERYACIKSIIIDYKGDAFIVGASIVD